LKAERSPDIERTVQRAVANATTERQRLVELVALLASVPSAAGDELAAADAVVGWTRRNYPQLRSAVDPFGTRANVVIESGDGGGRDLGLYAHLDTSLTGDADRDGPITGRWDEPTPFRVDGDDVVALGLAVARAPAAAALVAAASASEALDELGVPYRLRLLLASGGTHRWPPNRDSGFETNTFGIGARRAIDSGFRPGAVIDAKGGAPAPLHEEPGAAYFGLRIIGTWEPALFRSDDPGTIGAIPCLIGALENWRREVIGRPYIAGSPSGREVALGAITAGSLDKPDLLPAVIEARIFVVLGMGDDPVQLAAELETVIGQALIVDGSADLTVKVTVDVADSAGATSPLDPVVVAANTAWTSRFGPPPVVSGWRGSTDGVVFRRAGIPTVRVGPTIARDEDDPRLDRVGIDTLTMFAGLYAETATRWILRLD
jgi:acetylornithine deacetylase/succinyl-diaminopimelate desuccinylase-like protein